MVLPDIMEHMKKQFGVVFFTMHEVNIQMMSFDSQWHKWFSVFCYTYH